MQSPEPPEPTARDDNDGLTPVRCPYCGTIWFRSQVGDIDHLMEVKCPRCRRFVIFRVTDYHARDILAVTLPEGKAPSARSPQSSNGDRSNAT